MIPVISFVYSMIESQVQSAEYEEFGLKEHLSDKFFLYLRTLGEVLTISITGMYLLADKVTTPDISNLSISIIAASSAGFLLDQLMQVKKDRPAPTPLKAVVVHSLPHSHND